MDPLTSAEKKYLRGRAQNLKPILRVGKHGLSSAVFQQIENAFENHSLIKIRFETGRSEMKEWIEQITGRTGCECVGEIGKTASFYREKTLPP